MSKIGRKPINIDNVEVDIKNKVIHYKGTHNSGTYQLPSELLATLQDKDLKLAVDTQSVDAQKKSIREMNRVWGLHRALLANEIAGAAKKFEKVIKITGLGFKAQVSGKNIVFVLGYSHKIDFELPETVIAEVDRTGQVLTLKSPNRELVGLTVSKIEALRPTEPYKGTGVSEATKFIFRKAGKTKAG